MKHILSTELKNRYGIVVKTMGINTDAFKDNPIMLFNHDPDKIIGHWEDLHIEDGNLIATPVFSATAQKEKTLNDEGNLKSVSIGLSYQDNDIETDEDTMIINKCELFEASLVSIPANKECTRFKFFNKDSNKFIKLSMTKKSDKEIKLQDEIKSLKKEIDQHKELGEELKATKVLLSTQEDIVKKVQAENEKLKTALASLKTSEQDKFLQKAFDDNIIDKGQHEAFKKLDFSVVKRTIDNMTPKSLVEQVEKADTKVDLSVSKLGELMEMYETNPEFFKLKK